jgi:23S rRNA (adenine2503-C2)-methyltransferase
LRRKLDWRDPPRGDRIAPVDTLSGLTVADLEEKLAAVGLHRRDVRSFDEMTDVSKEDRAKLPENFRLLETEVKGKHESPDGTTKFLVGLTDGDVIETVLIPEGPRRTVCVSTQVGCPIKCVFCASGLNGLKRNLNAAEIVEQIIHVKRALPEGERISNVVIMGIGEPLLNAKNLMKALRILKASWGQGIGFNRITLSTVGVLGQLEELIKHRVTPNLALSLHAPNDEIRAEVVPTMKNVKVTDIIKAGQEYHRLTGKEVTFEYVLLEGVNDDKKHALELGKKLRGSQVKVNVIPFNRVEEVPYKAPSRERVDRFVQALGNCGVPVMVRKRKGDEVAGACGQLRARFVSGKTG